MASKHTISMQLLFSWMFIMVILASKTNAKCSFEAIFSFGDSNTDTGGFYTAFPSQPSPYGMTYFNKPTGRYGDGRLFIDFLAQAVGVPFLSPYLQSIGSDFKHGVNFASAGSTVQQPNSSVFVSGVSPFYLDVQINQLKIFKAKVEEYQSQGQTNLPQPDVFGKALYTINAGQNDFTGYIDSAGPDGFKQVAPTVVSGIVSAVKEIYNLGGRTIMVFNLAPLGCYPALLAQYQHDSSDLDEAGCMKSFDNAVNDYNWMLKDAIGQARQELTDVNLIYADIYSNLLGFFQSPSEHGFQHGTTACCGSGGGSYNFIKEAFCGNSKASACADPQNYVSWDGIHLTENANKNLANAFLSGSDSNYYDPSVNLNQYCDVQTIG